MYITLRAPEAGFSQGESLRDDTEKHSLRAFEHGGNYVPAEQHIRALADNIQDKLES